MTTTSLPTRVENIAPATGDARARCHQLRKVRRASTGGHATVPTAVPIAQNRCRPSVRLLKLWRLGNTSDLPGWGFSAEPSNRHFSVWGTFKTRLSGNNFFIFGTPGGGKERQIPRIQTTNHECRHVHRRVVAGLHRVLLTIIRRDVETPRYYHYHREVWPHHPGRGMTDGREMIIIDTPSVLGVISLQELIARKALSGSEQVNRQAYGVRASKATRSRLPAARCSGEPPQTR